MGQQWRQRRWQRRQEQQQKQIEEEEIQKQRRFSTYGGGFCFKARLISIEYIYVKAEDGKELIF